VTANDDAAQTYWLGQWVDEYEVASADQALGILELPGPMARLAELAETAPAYGDPNQEAPDFSVAAGRGIDLSGYMSCRHFDCMQKAVNSAFPNIFHYFDNIIVQGASPRAFTGKLKTLPKNSHRQMHWDISQDVAIILYLREIGAYERCIFREKPAAFCEHHMNEFARKYKVPAYRNTELLHSATERLATEADFKTAWRKGVWSFWIDHDFFPEPAFGRITRGKKRRPQPLEMASQVINTYTGGSLADVVFAKKIGAPLARAIDTRWIDPGEADSSSTTSDVALYLDLPVIDGISIRDLLALRAEEHAYFDKFRDALRIAIEAQLQKGDSAAPQAIAQSVVREYINPTLADIDARLKVNQKKLSRKIGASLTVGSAVTSAGLIGTLPLLVATGVAAMATALPQIYQYFDDYGEKVELNDLFFLWKARRMAGSGHSTSLPITCR
jgi:hypothetical protein